MNKASRKINYMLDHYCSPEAIEALTGNGFFANLMQNFGHDFNTFLYKSNHVQIYSYDIVAKKLKFKPAVSDNPDDLCLYNADKGMYRFVQEKDAGAIQSLIKKWYQCSGEINLRLTLLFDSKLGTRYLAEKSKVEPEIISKVRHGHTPVNHISIEARLALENCYMNSKFAQHIRNQHITLKV